MNMSGSGFSFTRRTKWGSYGTSGFSIRTGIPGLYYRKRYSRKKGDPGGIIFLLIAVAIWIIIVLIQIALIVAFILFKVAVICLAFIITVLWEVTKWCALTFWDFSKYSVEQWRARRLSNNQPPVIAESTHRDDFRNDPPNT